jgi:VanZ family protein
MTHRRYRGSLVVWALLLAYASLYPFFPLRAPSMEAANAVFGGPHYLIRSDIAFNVIAYLPLGMFACLYFRGVNGGRRAMIKAVALGAGFSLAMETMQLFVPHRHSSAVDLASNATGAFLGALVFAEPIYSAITRHLGTLRESMVIPGAWGDAGLVLVMLWLLAQLNPALPFFGAGDIGGEARIQVEILQWASVAMAVCGFGLFVSALLKAEQGTLRVTLVLLSIALWLKFAAAPLLLQPHFRAEWVNEGRIAGLAVGILALLPVRRMARPGRVYLGLVLILAGALFSKIFGAYSPAEELVRLFRWPHGQVGSFATLTRFLHELWPFAAVVFLSAMWVGERRAHAADAATATSEPAAPR